MWRKLKIYQKLILIFFTAIIIIYIMSFYVYKYSLKNINENVIEKLKLNSKSITEQIDNGINNIVNFNLDMLKGYKLRYLDGFSSDDDKQFEYYNNINEIIEQLRSFSKFNFFIKDIKIYLNSDNSIVSSNHRIINKNDRYYEDYILDADPAYRGSLQNIDGNLVVYDYLSSSYIIDNMIDASLIIYVELDKVQLQKYLYSSLGDDLIKTVILDDSYNILMKHNITDDELKKIKSTEVKEVISNNDASYIAKLKTQYTIYEKPFGGLGKLILISDNSAYEAPIKNLNIIFLSISLLAIIISVFYALIINEIIHKPIKLFINAFKELEHESYNIKLENTEINEFNYLYESFNNMVNKIKVSIELYYEQKMALQASELKQLQLQINPHFLYNGFYNIQRMCSAGEYDTVSLLSKRLATYYQYITRNGIEEVPFYMELKHTKDYIDIQHIRFRERIVVNIQYNEEDIENCIVPRLILQPIVENIYEHAFNTIDDNGRIDITIKKVDESLIITIEDNGDGLNDDELNNMNYKLSKCTGYAEYTGILNVNKRLKIKYGNDSGISLKENQYGGLCAEIIINYKREERYV